MKRLIACGFVLLSFFGLMVLARGGGGGRGGSGGGGGRMGGGSGGHFGGGRSMGGSSLGSSHVSGRTALSGSTRVSPTTRLSGATRVSPTTRVGRSNSRFSGDRGRDRWHGHNGRGFRRNWSGPIFWDTGLYPYFYDYCSANPWDERCYDGYDDYIEPGFNFGFGY